MTFGFSQTDRKTLDNLPGKISQKVREDIKQAEDAAIDSINKHAEATMEKYGNLLDQKLEAAKKEMGVNKGIFLSWYNFWTMLILTVFSTSYTVYTTFGLHLYPVYPKNITPKTRQKWTLNKPKLLKINNLGFYKVGVTGLEPATTWSQTRCATGLRYTPQKVILQMRMQR